MVVITTLSPPQSLPDRAEVKWVSFAAASEPLLNESEASAELFAGDYEDSLNQPDLTMVVAQSDDSLLAFAYVH